MKPTDERGDAVVEFVALAVVVVVPLIALILTAASLQAGALATSSGAREAARILAAEHDSTALAREAATQIVRDQGLDAPVEVRLDCEGACAPGAMARVEVATRVGLPFLPGFIAEQVGGSVPVSATTALYLAGEADS